MTASWPAPMPGAWPTAGRRTTATRPISRRSRRVANESWRRPMSWFLGTTRRFRHGGTRIVADLSSFDALVDERFDDWVEELRDFCAIPCETDSAHLAPLLGHRPEFFEGEGALIEGGGVDEKGRPQLVCGVRGMVYVELRVRTLGFDAHSGGAQLLPNAGWRLIEALTALRAPDGTVTIDGFLDDLAPPTEEQLEHLRTLPFEEKEIKRIYEVREFVGGRTGWQAQIADTFQPTCNISGISSGWTDAGVKTITPAEAFAKVDMRLIPNQDPARIAEAVRVHLDTRGFKDVEMTIHRGEHPYWTPIDDPVVDAAERAHSGIVDEKPMRGSFTVAGPCASTSWTATAMSTMPST